MAKDEKDKKPMSIDGYENAGRYVSAQFDSQDYKVPSGLGRIDSDRRNLDMMTYMTTGQKPSNPEGRYMAGSRKNTLDQGFDAGMSLKEIMHYGGQVGIKNLSDGKSGKKEMEEIVAAYTAEKLGGTNADNIDALQKQIDEMNEDDEQTPGAITPTTLESQEYKDAKDFQEFYKTNVIDKAKNVLEMRNSEAGDMALSMGNFDTRSAEVGVDVPRLDGSNGEAGPQNVVDTANTSPLDNTGVEDKYGTGLKLRGSQLFANDYKSKVKEGMKMAGTVTRGPKLNYI